MVLQSILSFKEPGVEIIPPVSAQLKKDPVTCSDVGGMIFT
jgi:hypothetical protein